MLSEYIISLADVSFHIVAYMYARFQYSGKNPMRFAVFGRISVRFCGFRTPLTLPSCNLCDAGYVGYTRGHLHERVDGHRNHRQFVKIILANISRMYHLSFQNNFTCSLKVLTNMIAN